MSEEEATATAQQPTTAIIVLGDAMMFQPSDEVLSVTITAKEEMSNCMHNVAADSIEALHVVLRASSIGILYDENAIGSFVSCLRKNAEVTVHLLNNPSESDLQTIKMSLVMAGLRIDEEAVGSDGSNVVTARNDAE